MYRTVDIFCLRRLERHKNRSWPAHREFMWKGTTLGYRRRPHLKGAIARLCVANVGSGDPIVVLPLLSSFCAKLMLLSSCDIYMNVWCDLVLMRRFEWPMLSEIGLRYLWRIWVVTMTFVTAAYNILLIIFIALHLAVGGAVRLSTWN